VASQAFVINRTLALQFHPELDAAALKGWLDWGGDVLVEKDGQDTHIMMEQTIALEEVATAQTFDLIDNFIAKVVNPS
jgi:GMP synthase-like glutamine amidotransferase